MGYVVMVDDNFHFMDQGSRYRLGDFEDVATAIGRCRSIVDEYLALALQPGMAADELYENYVTFGEDPFICCVEVPAVTFSAWDHAWQQAKVLCSDEGASGG